MQRLRAAWEAFARALLNRGAVEHKDPSKWRRRPPKSGGKVWGPKRKLEIPKEEGAIFRARLCDGTRVYARRTEGCFVQVTRRGGSLEWVQPRKLEAKGYQLFVPFGAIVEVLEVL